MSKAGAVASRVAANMLASRESLTKHATTTYEAKEAERIEHHKRFIVNKLAEVLHVTDVEPVVARRYERFFTPHRCVIAEVDDLTFCWLEAYDKQPKSLAIIDEHCDCGRPAPRRIHSLDDLGEVLEDLEKRKATRTPFECRVCRDQRLRKAGR